MNSRKMTKKPLKAEPVTFCPHCSEELNDLTFTDGETISLNPHRANADAGLMWGRCDNCFETLYLLEIAIITPGAPGQFVNDFCWTPDSYQRYEARVCDDTHPWLLTEYAGISDIMVTDKKFNPHLTETAWLDLHCFAAWQAADRQQAFNNATKIAGYVLDHAARI